jgi:hypothetical protein
MADQPPAWMGNAPASGPEQYGDPTPAGKRMSTHEKMKATPLPTVLRYLRMSNLANGLLSSTASVLCFMSIPMPTEAFMAVYLICFSAILVLFECRLFGESMLRENFGFLFSYWGRFGFLCL